jgi:dihydrofolate synthase/folylpolyglutamate synthase
MGFHANTYAVFGMLKDKDIDSVIEILKGRIDFWCIAGLDLAAGTRGASLETLAGKLETHGLGDRFSRHVSVAKAYAAAREKAGENDRILVFGSFYTVAEILQLIQST